MASLLENLNRTEWLLEDMRVMDEEYDKLSAELAELQNPRVYAKVSDIPGETQSVSIDEKLGQQLGGQGGSSATQAQRKTQTTTSQDTQTTKDGFRIVPRGPTRTKEQIERDMLNVLLVKQSLIPGSKRDEVLLYRDENGRLIAGTARELGDKYKGRVITKIGTEKLKNPKEEYYWVNKLKKYVKGQDEAAELANNNNTTFHKIGDIKPDDINKKSDNTSMLLVDRDGTIYGFGKGLEAPLEDYILRNGQKATRDKYGNMDYIPESVYNDIYQSKGSKKVTEIDKLRQKWAAEGEEYKSFIGEFFKDIKDKKAKREAITKAINTLRTDESSLYKFHDLFVDGDIKQYYGIMSDTTLMSGMFEGKNQKALAMENYLKTTMRDFHASFIKKLSGDNQAIPVTVQGGDSSLSISEWNNFKALRANKQYELMRSRALRNMQSYVTDDADNRSVLENNPVNLIRQVLEENSQSTGGNIRTNALRLNFNPEVVSETFNMLNNPNISIEDRVTVDNMLKDIKMRAVDMKRLNASDSLLRQELNRVFSNFPPKQREAFVNEVMTSVGKQVSINLQNTRPAGSWFNNLFMNNQRGVV